MRDKLVVSSAVSQASAELDFLRRELPNASRMTRGQAKVKKFRKNVAKRATRRTERNHIEEQR